MSLTVSILAIVGGVILITLAISKRWVDWLRGKGNVAYWMTQYILLFFAVWAFLKGLVQVFDMMSK